MRVQITASFTAEPVEEPLRFLLSALESAADLSFSPFNQVVQQVLDPGSAVRRQPAEHVFLLRPRDLAPGDPGAGLRAFEEALGEHGAALRGFVLVLFCPHPEDDAEDASREAEAARRIRALGHAVVESRSLIDLLQDAAVYDAEAQRAGQVPFTAAMFSALAIRLARHIHAWSRPSRKLIVVDADNTLWSGVLGEDGREGIAVERPHAFLQEFLLERRSQGFLLAISSKNDADDLARVLTDHSEMLLRGEHFVSQRVNWKPKSENVAELCAELGLGLESVIFIDDNPAETAEVAAGCPGVYTITLPPDPADFRACLERCWAFDLGSPATAEDRVRSEMYQAQASRETLRDHSDSFHAFLENLQLKVQLAALTAEDHTRVAQLSARTNQFNACQEPFQPGRLAECQERGETAIKVEAADRFGDYGLVGGIIFRSDTDCLDVSAFFLSCRALGKGVERRMVRRLGEEAEQNQLDTVRVRFRDAERNGVCRSFFEEIGAEFLADPGAFQISAQSAAALDPLPSRDWDPANRSATEQQAPRPAAAFNDGIGLRVEEQWGDPVRLAEHLAARRLPRPELSEPRVAPASALETELLGLWESVLGMEGLGVEDRFTALGGRSLQLVQMHARLLREFHTEIPLTDLFELPTVRALARRMEAAAAPAPVGVVHSDNRQPNEAIAIVGMAIRAPGADSVEAFWSNLKNGVESLHRFSDEELASSGIDADAVRQDPRYVPVKGCLSGIDRFDAAFFGILPKEAKLMDPQQRLFLELAWETLERAGYDPDAYSGKIGVWAGAYLDSYLIANLCSDKAFHANWIPAIQVGSLQTELGNDKDYLATRVSFKLNLRGPSMTVQTACSTSMVAIAQAIQSLRAGESDMAMAGGITITLPEKKGYQYTEDGMLAKDGRVCTFSDEASGTVFGNGAGIVLLKRLSEAERDGDHIHAVIRGAALNNDGGVKHSYTAPSVEGQVEVITMAQRNAGVDPDTITYIEAHGTGTPLGDPIEVAALTKCFAARTDRKEFCTLGSVKPNVGHLDVASGVCGVIKTALSLEHGQIPPLLHYQRPNPKIAFAGSPFRVQTELTDWKVESGPRRAGVSSFGVGGTNGHVILEEAPARPERPVSTRPAQLFLLSGRTESARDAVTARWTTFAGETELCLSDAAFTAAVGRRGFAKRRVCVAGSWKELAEKLTGGKGIDGGPGASLPAITFQFPGQGAQHVGMASALMASEPVFREHVDACAEILEAKIGADLRDVLYPAQADEAATDRLKQTLFAQPAIFVIETGMAKLWQSWGVTPHAMLGHSVGEFAAACVAGVFTLEEGLDILATRGRLMGELPGGAMLSVRLSEEAIQPYLGEADLAAVNGKELCVLAGSHAVIGEVEKRLETDGVAAKHLHTSHGFHSRMMDPVIEPFAREIARAELRPPNIPIFSTVTGDWLSEDQASDPDYWARHLRQPVRFNASAKALADTRENQIFLEVGPGQTLTTLARQSVGRTGGHRFLASCAHAAGGGSDYEQLLASLGQFWLNGIAIDWGRFYAHESPHRVVLPPYPFERKRHWVEAQAILASDPIAPALTNLPPESLAAFPPVTPPAPADFPTTATEAQSMSHPPVPAPPASSASPRRAVLAAKMREILSELSDIPEEELAAGESFLELGFDSLLLTQVSKSFQDAFSARVTMRQLIDELPTIDALVEHLDATLDPAILAPAEPPAAPVAPSPVPAAVAAPLTETVPVPAGSSSLPPASPAPAVLPPSLPLPAQQFAAASGSVLESVVQQQMDLMRQQLAVLQGIPTSASAVPVPVPAPVSAPASAPAPAAQTGRVEAKGAAPATPDAAPGSAAHGPYKPINRTKDAGLTEQQAAFVADLTARYNAKTRLSKERTQQYRHCFADPRTANGFNRLWKDMCYQIIAERAKGSRLRDIDGNEFIDLVNGFGPGFLGHSPDFVTEALRAQLDKTIAVGPQSELAGETAELVCKLLGADRVCFLNTGSEAVQAAMRLARTVTGRDRIVVFSRDYHGNFDEVLVKGSNRNGKFKSLPIAPGIPRRAVEDVLVLEYGSEESLQVIREQGEQLAAVLVEPMQSRRPEFQPLEFVRELRKITEETGCLFIFDEVVTGFRTGPRGAQEFYGVQADLATYGKVIGGGMPVGLVAGKREFMDTFDGGHWQYGDDSFPEAPVTFFAGTFVRHPLTVAAVNVMAKHFLEQPRSFWDTIDARAARLAGSVDQFFVDEGIGIRMPHFSSQMFVRVSDEEKYGGLLFCQLREKGVFILEGLPCYLTAAHTDADIDYVIDAVQESVADMRAGGFFGGQKGVATPGERLGKQQGPSRQLEVAPAVAPLTTAQQEVWLACHLDREASCAFNEATTLHMRGALRLDHLESAVNAIIARHDALRATFSQDGSEIRFARSLPIALPVHDLTRLSPEARDERLCAFKEQEVSLPIDLENGPLIRGCVVRLKEDESVLFLTIHHIVCDGWSYNLLMEELSVIYSALCRGERATLPEPDSFGRHAAAKAQSRGKGDVFEYWKRLLSPPPDPIALPTDRPYPATRSFAGASERRVVSLEIARGIKRVGAKQKCTAYQTFLGVFEVLLGKLTGQSDFIVGQPAAGQGIEDNPNLVGHCVNFLPLRAKIDQGESFSQHLAGLRMRVMDAFDHQDFTYGELLPVLDLPRSSGRMPLVEVVLTRDIHATALDTFEGLQATFEPSTKRLVNFPLFINIIDCAEGLIIECDYQTDLFDRETIQRWLAHFEHLSKTLSVSPDAPLDTISLLGQSEEARLLHGWNATERDLGPETCLHHLIDGSSERVAVSQGDTRMTYGELDEEANALAWRLQELGVGPDDLVAVFLDRHPRTVAALLGVLKAGAAYVPLDPGFPRDRLEMMLADASPKAVVTTADLETRLPETTAPVLAIAGERREEAVVSAAGPEHLAYVIYTSGSTGKPKGVQIEHRAIVNFLRSMREEPGLDGESVLLAVTTLCFDISLLELFLPLICGARVEMATREQATNPELLAARIVESGATHLQATPVTWRLLLEIGWVCPPGFRMLCGGEPMPLDLAHRLADLPGELWNLYGPTETTVWSTATRVEPKIASVHIGRPIANTTVYLLDDHLRPVPIGLPGRLFLGGHGLARGYANRPKLTAEKFIPNPFPSALGDRLYDTGDLARYRSDGTLECLGRSDNQIKFNGYRIELGDIETAMRSHPQVANAAVKLVETAGAKRLAGYVVIEEGQTLDLDDLRTRLKNTLPDYMVPGDFQVLSAFPLTPNRKIDRRALPDQVPAAALEDGGNVSTPPAAAPVAAASRGDVIEKIAGIWEDLLGKRGLHRRANFFDVGGHSLLLLRLKNRLQETFEQPIQLAALFKHTTIESQAQLFRQSGAVEAAPPVPAGGERREAAALTRDIAVIGMSGRFPGAADLETFWDNLRSGVESIRDLSEAELRRAGVPAALYQDPAYVRRAGVIDTAESFDCHLFGISPREAELMNLQHRVFLEECYKALENGGYDPARYAGRIGVFAGSGISQGANLDSVLPSDYYAAMTGSQPDYLTTRVAYRLNLRGPSLTVQTGCSTSLVALQIATQNLRTGACEMALAGGISLVSPQGMGYLYEEGMMLSPDGHCRAFDANASGTVFTQGAGVVLLKPLEAALADGDAIRAVIRGAALNNDGSEKIGFTAPAIDGQAAVIESALAEQGIDPETIGLLETHGTGTPLGDPIELAALSQAYRKHTQRRGYCALGTLKSNVGHMDAAAGIGAFIKAVLALEKCEIPPSINYTEPNAKLDLEASPFTVRTELTPWERNAADTPRRAGVSSFGIGGTNAHVILEEAPERVAPEPARRPWQVLTFSAKSQAALAATADRGRRAAKARVEALPDLAFTLNTGRREYAHREVILASRAGLEAGEPLRAEAVERPVVFLFPGQGTAFHGMAKGLYESEAHFRKTIDECDALIEPLLGWKLADALFGPEALDWSATERAQPALFVIEYALAQLWKQWGVEPEAMIGHSIGEYVAACLAGVFTLADALRLVVERGRAMQAMAPGAMLAVPADRETVAELLASPGASGLEDCEIAVENSPRLTVVSGPPAAIDCLEEVLRERGQVGRRLVTSHAFHSAMMEDAAESFRKSVQSVTRNAPVAPYLSNLTGLWITAEEATSVDYWCRHLREAVRFSACVKQVEADLGEALFLELGPGNALSTFVRQHGGGHAVVAAMRHAKSTQSDAFALVEAVGRFWVCGGALDWEAFHGKGTRRRMPLPGYAMQRRNFEKPIASKTPALQPNAADWTTWLHAVRWNRKRPSVAEHSLEGETRTILFSESDGLALPNEAVCWPLSRWEEALASLEAASDLSLRVIVDARPEEADGDAPITVPSFERFQEKVLDRLIAFVREATDGGWQDIALVVVTPGGLDLEGTALGYIGAATLPGACLTLQQDLPGVRCRVIDLAPSADPAVFTQLLSETGYEPVSAVRGRAVYVPEFVPWRRDSDGPGPDESASASPASLLEGEGAIVITGGVGAIGWACAERIASCTGAPIVLVGRLRNATGGQSGDAEAQAGAGEIPVEELPDPLRERVDRWPAGNAPLSFYRADMADRDQVRRLCQDVEAKYGSIGGVIHAAGLVETVSIPDYGSERRREIQSAKVHGAIHLAEALREREPDGAPRFVTLVSSVSSVLGGLGYSAYASANAFLDSLAAREDGRTATRWFTLGLDAVAAVSAGEGKPSPQEMTTRQAGEILCHQLACPHGPSRLVVSKTALSERRERWVYGMAKRQELQKAALPAVAVTDADARVETVQAIWKAALKLDELGPDENFFDLGGDSILAIPMFQRLTEEFGVALPIATLFQASTPAKLAQRYAEVLEKSVLPRSGATPGGRNGDSGEKGWERKNGSSNGSLGVANGSSGSELGTASASVSSVSPSPYSDRLIIKMRDGDAAKSPIFFTHPGGGSIVFYHAILQEMQDAHPLYGIESPLLSQERFELSGMESIEAIARGYTALVRQVQRTGPYILAGYSFGGLVSLEMARLLRESGEAVHLLVFDTPNPSVEFHTNKLSERLSHHWNKDGALGEKLLRMSKRATRGMVNRIQTSVSRASARRLNGAEKPSRSARVLNFQILEIYDVLTEAYVPRPYPGNMDLFTAEDGGDKIVYDAHLGWKDVVQGELRVTSVPGSHLTLFEGENLKGFVQAVERCLQGPDMMLRG